MSEEDQTYDFKGESEAYPDIELDDFDLELFSWLLSEYLQSWNDLSIEEYTECSATHLKLMNSGFGRHES